MDKEDVIHTHTEQDVTLKAFIFMVNYIFKKKLKVEEKRDTGMKFPGISVG